MKHLFKHNKGMTYLGDCSAFVYLSPILIFEDIKMAMINPKRPMALPKISMIKILTNREGLAASARAAPDPKNKSVNQ